LRYELDMTSLSSNGVRNGPSITCKKRIHIRGKIFEVVVSHCEKATCKLVHLSQYHPAGLTSLGRLVESSFECSPYLARGKRLNAETPRHRERHLLFLLQAHRRHARKAFGLLAVLGVSASRRFAFSSLRIGERDQIDTLRACRRAFQIARLSRQSWARRNTCAHLPWDCSRLLPSR
jgi:hypothetical protein